MVCNMEELKQILEKEILTYKKEIQDSINIFEREMSDYRNIKIGNNLQLILRRGEQKLMHIGFPFPLESYHLEGFKSKKNTLIFLFLRGEKIRSFQRKELIEELKITRRVEYKEIESLDEFREITKELCNKHHEVNYYDPYSFLGDSFIGLYLIQNFIKKFNLRLNTIYSENYKNLEVVSSTQGYIGNIASDKNLSIFADLIDNQWSRTKYLVNKLTERGFPSLVCGRDLIIVPESGQINVYHFKREEILLRGENIEDYMRKCLYSFFEVEENKQTPQKPKTKNIIINPFGSENIKTIPKEIILHVAEHFNKFYPESKIIIISGFKNNYSHLLWISCVRGLLATMGLKNIIFKNYGSFSEIKRDIQRYDFAMGLTADTSIAHLFNFLHLRNLTFFNLDRCDLSSPQSLSSDSPLGFCRYGPIQYPVLVTNKLKKIKEGVIAAIDYFISGNKSLSWTNLIYDEDLLISKIKRNYKELISANMKISPQYKLKND